MKTYTLIAILVSFLTVSATSVQRRDTRLLSLFPFPIGRPAGAVFFMTNEGDENMVIAASIHSDGTLTLDRAVSTSGGGAHGIADPIGPDALFSQGSIQASSKGKVLATVNAGTNTVSLFSIDPSSPTAIEQIGNPVSSEGEFPVSLAFNDDGSRLCVLNGGTVSSVNCFSVSKKTGLKTIPNSLRSLALNQTTPLNGPPGSASNLIFTPDNKQLLASIKGVAPGSGFIAAWDVHADGSLSPEFKRITLPEGGLLTFSMTPIPGKNALLTTDPNIGFLIIDLEGRASSAIPIEGQSATCWSSHSTKTGNFYLTDVGTSTVTEVHVDDRLKATIVRQYPQAPGSATTDNDIVTVAGHDFFFILTPNATAVQVLALKGPGNAKHIQTLDVSRAARTARLTINPVNLQGMTHFIPE